MNSDRAQDRDRPPTRLLIPTGKTPNIGVLPDEVADRLDGMSCVLTMAIEYVSLKTQRDTLYECASKMRDVIHDPSAAISLFQDERFCFIGSPNPTAFETSVERQVNEDPKAKVWLQGMQVDHMTCLRVGVQCALSLCQIAVDTLSDAKEILERSLLLRCLKEVRNVSVHQTPMSVTNRDVSMSFLHRETGEEVSRMQIDNEWFLKVELSELTSVKPMTKTKEPRLSKEDAMWFAEVCEANPISLILTAAVGDLCSLYYSAHKDDIDQGERNERPYHLPFFRRDGRMEGLQ